MKVYDHYVSRDPLWRRALIGLSIRILYPVSERFFIDAPEITVADHIRWKIEGFADWIFCLGYEGSNDEICSALNGEIPVEYMNARQRAAVCAEFGEHPPINSFGCINTIREVKDPR